MTVIPGSFAGIYYLVAADTQRDEFLVIEVFVNGPVRVVGRWGSAQAAEDDAARWTALETEDRAA